MTINSVLLKAEGYLAESDSRKYSNPVRNGLEISGFFNDSLEKVRTNFAPGKKNFIMRGTPVLAVDGNSVRFKGLANYLQTFWQESVAGTVMIVCATSDTLADDAHRPAFFGTSTGLPANQNINSTTFGVQFRITSAGAVRLNVGHGADVATDLQSSIAITVVNHAAYELFLLEWPGDAGLDKITSITSGATATWAGPAQARFPTRNRFRIGSSFVTNQGENDQMLIRGWRRALTQIEKDDEVADIKDYCLGRGVTI
ncbi:hypothetical protein OIU34_26565 [Pararhizobium sp. BT-229]|uniref:hypothetical protein n=1 Tax=Pararhizobium sp. BT-229 TaxID=2986923 RepID=UPI0021F6B269|nr:hypothetical protein [Pararhizobium sp. BT-229]MCV9965446.1 hypothetical protein [Pararhizobium sp. BT-229]